MPAITLGLAEIEERLQMLRRRLNTVTALHAASLALTAVFLVAAALIAVGARADPSSFRAVIWSALVLVVGIGVGCALVAHRRWVDELAAAELVDQRGQLTDRLTTLVDLRRHPRPSRLAPVLIAQTLALGERWRPQRIISRRVPRSVFAALLSLLTLAASPLVAPEPPPPAQSLKHQKGMLAEMDDGAAPAASLIGKGGPGEERAGSSLQRSGEVPAPQGQEDSAAEPQSAPRHSAPDRLLSLLPDPLHNAILSAVRAEPTDRGRALGNESESAGNRATTQSKEGATGATDERAGGPQQDRAQRRSGESSKTGSQDESGDARAQQHRDQANTKSQPPQPDPAGEPGQSGAAPNAGTGSSPENLLAAGGAANADAAATTTFKLTITSFLHPVEEPGTSPRQTDKRRADTVGAAPDRNEATAALNELQLRDDALRKAEIPPEYEDIVRRVYSTRDLSDGAH